MWCVYVRTCVCVYMSGFHTGFFERGGGESWLTYLASTFGRPEMSRVPFEQVLDIILTEKQTN